MRRIIYAIVLLVFCAFVMTACTEEPVTPRTDSGESGNGGGGSADPWPTKP